VELVGYTGNESAFSYTPATSISTLIFVNDNASNLDTSNTLTANAANQTLLDLNSGVVLLNAGTFENTTLIAWDETASSHVTFDAGQANATLFDYNGGVNASIFVDGGTLNLSGTTTGC